MLLKNQTKIIKALKEKQIGLMPTDTIYGLVALFSEPQAIKRIYRLKKRSLAKPPIILVANWKQAKELAEIDVIIRKWYQKQTKPTTLILTKKAAAFQQLKFWKRQTVALRIVQWKWLQTILSKTGPIVATSCNFSQQKPLTNWKQLLLWSEKVDFSVKKTAPGKRASRIYDWKNRQFVR